MNGCSAKYGGTHGYHLYVSEDHSAKISSQRLILLDKGQARPRHSPFKPMYLHLDVLKVEQSEVEVIRRVDVAGQQGHQLGLLLKELLRVVLFIGHLIHKLIQEDGLDLEILRDHEEASQPGQLHLRGL